MTDFLQEKREEIELRLAELRPVVAEVERLEEAVAALAALSSTSDGVGRTPATAPRRRGRPRRASAAAAKPARAKASPKAAGGRKVGRRKGSGKRSAEALAIIQGQPGVTIPEIAARMGIKQNYLYRILPDLEKDGAVRKEKRGWHPVAAKAAA